MSGFCLLLLWHTYQNYRSSNTHFILQPRTFNSAPPLNICVLRHRLRHNSTSIILFTIFSQSFYVFAFLKPPLPARHYSPLPHILPVDYHSHSPNSTALSTCFTCITKRTTPHSIFLVKIVAKSCLRGNSTNEVCYHISSEVIHYGSNARRIGWYCLFDCIRA